MDFSIPTSNLKLGYKNRDFSGYDIGTAVNPYQWDLNGNTLCGNFRGLNQVFSVIERFKLNKTYDSSHKISHKKDWVEFSTYKESYKQLTQNPQVFSDFKELDLDIKSFDESGKDVNYDVTGEFLDIGRYIEGVPEMFGQMHEGKLRGYRLKIFMQGGGSGGVSSERINSRAKRIIRLIDWLENIGVRVSLNVVYSNRCGHMDIMVKDYEDPMNIFDIGVVASTDFFRRIVFFFKEQSTTVDDTYGYSYSFSNRARKNLENITDGSTLVVTADGVRYGAVEEKFDEIEKELAESLEDNTFNKFRSI